VAGRATSYSRCTPAFDGSAQSIAGGPGSCNRRRRTDIPTSFHSVAITPRSHQESIALRWQEVTEWLSPAKGGCRDGEDGKIEHYLRVRNARIYLCAAVGVRRVHSGFRREEADAGLSRPGTDHRTHPKFESNPGIYEIRRGTPPTAHGHDYRTSTHWNPRDTETPGYTERGVRVWVANEFCLCLIDGVLPPIF